MQKRPKLNHSQLDLLLASLTAVDLLTAAFFLHETKSRGTKTSGQGGMGWGHLLHSNAPHGPLDSRWSRGLGRRGRGVGVTVCRPAGLGQEAVVIALDHLGALGGAGLLPVVKLVLAVRQAVFDGRWRRATTEGTDIGVLMTSVYMRIAVRRRQPEACPHKEQVMLGVQRSWTYSATQSRTHWTKTHGRQVGLHRSGLSGADTHHVCFWGVSSRDDHLFTIII